MAKAKRLPSGNWRVNLYVGKKPDGTRDYKSFTDPDKKTAEYLAAEYALTRAEKAKPMNMTVGEAIDRYIDTKTNVLSPSTIRGYRQIRRNRLPEIMDTKLGDLTPTDIQSSINADAIKHKPKSVRNAHGLLSAAMGETYPEFRFDTKLPQKVNNEITVPERNDIDQLITAIKGTYLEIPVLLAALLGLRRSEICALKGSDINLKKRTMTINKAMVRNDDREWIVKQPKSYAGTRTLELSDSIVVLLTPYAQLKDRIVDATPNKISDGFLRLRNKLGLKMRFHDLRHYNASIMLALGIPDKYAIERLGQATPNMLKGVYQHIM